MFKYLLLKSMVITVPLVVALFGLSLSVTHSYTKVIQIGSPESGCTVCGTYPVNIEATGWPLAAFNNIQSDNTETRMSYPDPGLHFNPEGIVLDFGFWLIISKFIVFPIIFIRQRKIRDV